MPNPSGSKEFWRCGKCGTPNPAASYLTHCVACGAGRALARTPRSEPPNSAASSKHARREPSAPHERPGRGVRILFAASSAYVAILLGVLFSIRTVGDRYWPVGLALLGPRWVWIVPPVVLAGLSVRLRSRRLLIVQGLGALLVLGPLMGFNLPILRLLDAPAEGSPRVRVLSLNRGGVSIDSQRLIRYLELHRIDVVLFQELGTAKNPELDAFFGQGWSVDKRGHVASRAPMQEEVAPPPEENADQERYTMTLHRAVVRRDDGLRYQVGSVHMPTLTRGFSGAKETGFNPERFTLHLNWWSKEFLRLIEAMGSRRDEPLIIAGDLNMPSDHPLVAEIRRSGLYRLAFEERGWGFGFTKPVRTPWIRIDHILASPEWSVTQCWIGPDFGSDHKSIVAELALPPGQVGR